MTERETVQAAFAALLRGDTAERDRLLAPLLEAAKAREAEVERRRQAFLGAGEPIVLPPARIS